ncbi:MAG: Eco29kI family restriction endonuclease [Planctomycetota bacterium]|nr:Eco29kI family restriction endonuclease [Planctomycetota bacterium]
MSRRQREAVIPPEPEPNPIAVALSDLLDSLPHDVQNLDRLSGSKRKSLREKVKAVVEALVQLSHRLDPINRPGFVLDPSDPNVLGKLIAATLLEQPRVPLAGLPKFYGSGVYALYYNGPFEAYAPIRGTNVPIYVGKVDPENAGAIDVEDQGTKLRDRLTGDHGRSIRSAENLDEADFECRYLVVKSAWQNTAETYLIEWFHPVWNNESGVCYGIGKHGDSATTRTNTRSPWDELHPGRSWALSAANRANPKGREGILADIAGHFERHPPTKPR